MIAILWGLLIVFAIVVCGYAIGIVGICLFYAGAFLCVGIGSLIDWIDRVIIRPIRNRYKTKNASKKKPIEITINEDLNEYVQAKDSWQMLYMRDFPKDAYSRLKIKALKSHRENPPKPLKIKYLPYNIALRYIEKLPAKWLDFDGNDIGDLKFFVDKKNQLYWKR